jgi:hypothetical protein
MATSTGKVGLGVTFKIGDGNSPEVFTAVGNVANISVNGRSVDEIDFTHLGSTGSYRELRAGFKDAGEVQLTVHWNPASETTHTTLETMLNAGTVFNFEINLFGAGIGKKLTGAGFVKGGDISISGNDPITEDLVIRVTGPLEIEASAGA